MALGTLTEIGGAGFVPSRPTYINKFTLVGDGAYPTGGTLLFQQAVRTGTGDQVTLLDVTGYGFTGAALTHFARYDVTTDALLVYVLAGTQVPNATDLSGVTFHLTAIGQ